MGCDFTQHNQRQEQISSPSDIEDQIKHAAESIEITQVSAKSIDKCASLTDQSNKNVYARLIKEAVEVQVDHNQQFNAILILQESRW